MKNNFRSFFSSTKYQIKTVLHSSLMRFIIFIQPLLYGILLFLLFNDGNEMASFEELVLGNGMINLWSTIVFAACGQIDSERRNGTMELLNAVPVSFETIISAKILGTIFLGLSSGIFGYIFLSFLCKKALVILNIEAFLLTLLLSIACLIFIAFTFSLIFACFRQARDFINASEAPVFILSGFVFPVSILPQFIQPLSYLLPTYYIFSCLKFTMLNKTLTQDFYRDFFILGLMTILFFIIKKIAWNLGLKTLRKNGRLSFL